MNEQLGAKFTPYFEVEAVGQRIGLVSCLTCEAALIIGDKDFEATRRHSEWHEEQPAAPQPEGEPTR